MKLRIAAATLAVLALCYLGAGAPTVALLLKPAAISDGLTLKAITYHWANRFDRALPDAELLASRFYVLVFAAVTVLAAISALKADRDAKSFAFALGWSIVVLVVLVCAQTQAFYTVG
jgi:malonyl CoA-acyl carrier protein transacylase